MPIPPHLIKQYQALYLKELNQEITEEYVEDETQRALRLFHLIRYTPRVLTPEEVEQGLIKMYAHLDIEDDG